MLSIGATTAEELEVSSQEDREAVASDLLNVLHRYDLSLPQIPRTYYFPRAAFPFSPLLRMVPPSYTRSASSPRPFWMRSERRKRPLYRPPAPTHTYGTSFQSSLKLRGITCWMTMRMPVLVAMLYRCLPVMRNFLRISRSIVLSSHSDSWVSLCILHPSPSSSVARPSLMRVIHPKSPVLSRPCCAHIVPLFRPKDSPYSALPTTPHSTLLIMIPHCVASRTRLYFKCYPFPPTGARYVSLIITPGHCEDA